MSELPHEQDYKAQYPEAVEDMYQAEDMAYAGNRLRSRAARRRKVGDLILNKAVLKGKDGHTILTERADELTSNSELPGRIADEEFFVSRLASRALHDEPNVLGAMSSQYRRAGEHDNNADAAENKVAAQYDFVRRTNITVDDREFVNIPVDIIVRANAVAGTIKAQPAVARKLQFYGSAKKNELK